MHELKHMFDDVMKSLCTLVDRQDFQANFTYNWMLQNRKAHMHRKVNYQNSDFNDLLKQFE